MSNFKSIRDLLGVTQAALASGMGCTQGNVSFYEKGQTVPPDASKRLIDYAATLGRAITFNDIYCEDAVDVSTSKHASELVKHAGDTTKRGPVLKAVFAKAEQPGLVKLPKPEKPSVRPSGNWDGVTKDHVAKQERRAGDRARDAELAALDAGKGAA